MPESDPDQPIDWPPESAEPGASSAVLVEPDAAGREPDDPPAEDAELPVSAGLGPADRVFPTWTDPTVRRAADLIGGPVGRHALVGRNLLFTPLRVALALGVVVLICAWLFKSPCIQQGPGGGLDQGGQRPWISGCYNDVVPLYGGRGLDDAARNPYSYSWLTKSDGSTQEIYPRAEVHEVNGVLIADEPGGAVTLAEGAVVGNEGGSYYEVTGGQLVPFNLTAAGDSVNYLEYPVLTGMWMWGIAQLNQGYLNFATQTQLVPVPLNVASYFTIGAILLGLIYLWVINCTVRIAGRRVWDAVIACLSPLLIVQAYTNWDLLAMGFTAGAMLAWARKRSVLAGVLFGLGAAAKLYPIFLLGPLLVLCLRTGRMRAWWTSLAGAVVAWLAVNAWIFLQYRPAWSEFYTMSGSRGPEWDSWYFLYATITGNSSAFTGPGNHATALLNVLSLALFVVACIAIAWLALAARRRPRFVQLAFLIVAAFLLTNKVWSPQYSMWLLPLVALALPRWRRVLCWQFAEVCVWMLLMLSFDSDTSRNISIYPFVGAALVRDTLLIAIIVRVIREIVRPELDLIRQAGDDDPTGGVLDRARDTFVLPSLPALLARRRADRWPDPGHAATAVQPATLIGSDVSSVAPVESNAPTAT